MTGLDTNVLVRYIMQDDSRQSAQATAVVESLSPESPGFVALVTVVELECVLSSAYDVAKAPLADVLEELLRTKELVVERAEIVWQAPRLFRRASADCADCLMVRSAAAAGYDRTVTFDRQAAKGCGMVAIA